MPIAIFMGVGILPNFFARGSEKESSKNEKIKKGDAQSMERLLRCRDIPGA